MRKMWYLAGLTGLVLVVGGVGFGFFDGDNTNSSTASSSAAHNRTITSNRSAESRLAASTNSIDSSEPDADVVLPQGITFVEKQSASTDIARIAYAKYKLDNGLTVILSPDHSDPLVHLDVTYHVGSAREQIGRSGFAHFFEHMMFQGSEHVGDQQHFKLITEAGGTLNGSTNRDRTNYFETVPRNQLEKVMWLESDRMGFLVNAISQKKFEIQRSTVKNERGQNYDNRPYGLMYERIGEALYPKNHPYSWQTIGYVEDLDRVDVNDLKDFFLRWYGPNNAVLTIGGDLDQTQTLAWVKKYFGSIPAGPEVKKAEKAPVTLTEDRFITLPDNIQQPMVMMAFPARYEGEDSQASLDILAAVLGQGKTSLLYQKLVKTQKAVDAGAFHDCAELSCTLYVYAMGDSAEKGNLATLYQMLNKTMDEFNQKGVEQSRLDEIVGGAEASTIFSLESVSGKVSQLASNQTYYDTPDRLQIELADLKSVSTQSVMESFREFVYQQPKVTLSVVPKDRLDLQVKEPNFTPPARDLPQYSKVKDADLDVRTPVDEFDRNNIPVAGKIPIMTLPEIYRFTLGNESSNAVSTTDIKGIEGIGSVSRETPTVDILLSFPAGSRYEAKGKEGLASITAQLMDEGTTSQTTEAIDAQLDKLGSSITFGSGDYTTTMAISSLKIHLDETLKLAQEMLYTPAFNQDAFELVQKQALEGVVYSHQNPQWMATQAMKNVMLGDSLFARDAAGTAASLSALTLDDVNAFYQQHYTPVGAQIVVVGDIDKSDVTKRLDFLSTWKGEASELPDAGILPTQGAQTIYLVDKPDAPQSIVQLVRTGIPFDATGDFYLGQLANYNLAGNFNSRINQNLREDKAYTYGAKGGFSGGLEIGLVQFSAQVRADSTPDAIKELMKELDNYAKQGITNDELAFMQSAIGQKSALKYETPSKKAGLLSILTTYKLKKEVAEVRNHMLDTITKASLDSVAKRWFDPKAYQIIVVGDAKTLEPELKALGLPIKPLSVK